MYKRQLADLEGERYDAVLIDALSLYAPHGRRLLLALGPARRSALLARMEPVSHNARGFWTYADLLDDAERGARITAALAGFTRACSPSAAPRVKELISGLGPEHRTGLRAIADGQGPNARLVAEALASVD